MIPKAEIKRIKSLATDNIVKVIEYYVPLKKAGKLYEANCPFHDESTPSFKVDDKKGSWSCYGSCKEHGHAFDFVVRQNNGDFSKALEETCKILGVDMPKHEDKAYTDDEKQEYAKQQEIKKALGIAAAQYSNNLADDPSAIQYLAKRGMAASDLQRFSIGYAKHGFNDVTGLLTGTFGKEVALGTGIVKESDSKKVYDLFRDRIMFPIRDYRGDIVSFGGRDTGLHPQAIPQYKPPKYLNGAETSVFKKHDTLFGLYEARSADKNQCLNKDNFMLVEGYMDVVAMHRIGYTNTVAGMGTSVTPQHVESIFRNSDRIISVLDGDVAGYKSAFKLLQTSAPLLSPTKTLYFALLPTEEDPDSMIRNGRHKELMNILDNPISVSEFMTQYVIHSNENTPEGHAKAAAEIREVINLFKDDDSRTMYLNHFFKTIGIQRESYHSVQRESGEVYLNRMNADQLTTLQRLNPAVLALCADMVAEPSIMHMVRMPALDAKNPSLGFAGLVIKAMPQRDELIKSDSGEARSLLFKYLNCIAKNDVKELLKNIEAINEFTNNLKRDALITHDSTHSPT